MHPLAKPALAATLVAILAAAAQTPDPPPPEANPTPPAEIEMLPNGDIVLGHITLHRQQGTLSFPAAMHEPGVRELEVLIATPIGRLHETLVVADVRPLHLQVLLYLLNLRNGPRLPDADGTQGDLVNLDLEWTDQDGRKTVEPIEKWVVDNQTGQPMQRLGWVFTGSPIADNNLLADTTGNLVLVYSVGETILDIPSPLGNDDIHFSVNRDKKQPGPEAPVRVIVTPVKPAKPPAEKP